MSGLVRSSFDSNGVRIHFAVEGTGVPIVLIHGFIFRIDPMWVDSGLLHALGQTNRVAAFDLRGHGESGKPHDARSYGLEMVKDVPRLMDHLEIDRAHVVGYSIGGILALKLIELAPERLLSLVLGGAGWVQEGDSVHRGWTKLSDMLERITPGDPVSAAFWPNPNQRPSVEIQHIVDNNDPLALAAVARGMLNVTVAEGVLRSTRVPIRALFGEHDPVRTNVTTMKDVAPNFKVVIVRGVDHHTLAGSPKFLKSIRRFVSKT